MQGDERLEELAERFKSEHERGARPAPKQVTVREFMSWFGYKSQGKSIISQIRNKMEELEIQAVPDIMSGPLDSEISIEPVPGSLEVGFSRGLDDPTTRIGMLLATDQELTTVAPDEYLCTATSQMILKDYSQLPVVTGKRKHTVKGVISWQSIGKALASRDKCERVGDCMDKSPQKIGSDGPLLDAVDVISKHGYVLVTGEAGEPAGIVTASDVVDKFGQLAGSFLLIGEIERYLRKLVYWKFTVKELRETAQNYKGRQPVSGPIDLTFGEYIGLLENQKHWRKLMLSIDRVVFIDHLRAVNHIRNDVTHFRPNRPTDDGIKKLESLAKFFRGLS